MATAREVLQLIITGDGKSAVAEMKKVGAAAKTELGAAEKATVAMHTRMIAGGAAVAAGGAAVLFGLKQTTDAYLTAGRETMKLTRLTGGTTEEMSRLRFVATQAGVGVDGLATSVIRLSKSSQTTAGKSALASVGVDIDNADGSARGAVGILTDLATVFEGMPNGIEKNSLALKLFGRAGADMIPLLNRGGEGIQALIDQADQLGLTMNDEDVAKIKDYTAAQRELAAARESIKMQIGREVFPVVADGMENVANVVSATAEAFSRLPAPLKSTVGGVVSYGSAAAVAVGSVSLLTGVTQKMMGTMRAADGGLNLMGRTLKGLGPAAVGILAVGLAIEALNDSAAAGLGSVADLQAALNDASGSRMSTEVAAILKEIDDQADSVGDNVRQMLGTAGGDQYGDYQGLAKVREQFESLANVDPSQAERLLDAVTAAADRKPGQFDQEGSREKWDEVVAGIRHYIETQRLAAGVTAESGSAAASAATSLEAAAYAYERTGDAAEGAKPGAIAFAEAIRSALDPVMAVADANDRLADAQKNLAEVADTNSREFQDAQRSVADSWRGVEDAVRGVADAERGVVESRRRVGDATRNLSDAQEELNDLLNDDPMFGLTSVSPEDQIADARNRLAEANRRLVANPGDEIGLTMRDEALADLERATQRRQDLLREGDDRPRQIEDAQRRIEDAQLALDDANRGVSDAERTLGDAQRGVGDAELAVADARARLDEVMAEHGPNSEAYADAARDVIDAALGVQTADAELAQYLKDNGITAVDAMNGVLDDLASKGGPVAFAVAAMKGELEGLVGQAQAFAALLGGGESTWRPSWWPSIDTGPAAPKSPIPGWWPTFEGAPPKADSRPTGGSNRNTGGRDGNPRTPYHSGGTVAGARGQEVPILALGAEGMVNLPGMDFLGPGGLDAINAGRVPDRFRDLRVSTRPIPRLAGAAGSPGGSGGGGDSSVVISPEITILAPEPRLAGVAVVDEIRRVGHRAGRGVVVDRATGQG